MKSPDEWANEIASRFCDPVRVSSFHQKVELIRVCREIQHEGWTKGLDDLVNAYRTANPTDEETKG